MNHEIFLTDAARVVKKPTEKPKPPPLPKEQVFIMRRYEKRIPRDGKK